MTTIISNAGVPMLFVQWPYMILALPVVIIIEAALCKKWYPVDWINALKVSGKANAISTLVGFPLMWGALVVVQMVFGGGSFARFPEPWVSVYSVTVQAPWLLPYGDRMYWMIPTACLVLLVPAFFMTIFVEGRFYRRDFGDLESSVSIRSAIWRMHFASYTFLVLAGLVMLFSSIANHNN